MNNQQTKFDSWCIVELFGHSKIAGKCTEENIAGSNMLRVDVPETKKANRPLQNTMVLPPFMRSTRLTKQLRKWPLNQFR